MVKSFGYGVMVAEEIVDPLEALEKKEASRSEVERFLTKIQEIGMEGVIEVMPEPGNSKRAFILLDSWHEPHKFERSNLSEADIQAMRLIFAINKNRILGERLKFLEIQP